MRKGKDGFIGARKAPGDTHYYDTEQFRYLDTVTITMAQCFVIAISLR